MFTCPILGHSQRGLSKLQIRLCHLHALNLSEAWELPLDGVESSNLLTWGSSCSSPRLWLLLFPSFHPLLKPQWTFSPITLLSSFSALAHAVLSAYKVLPRWHTGLILQTFWDSVQKFSPKRYPAVPRSWVRCSSSTAPRVSLAPLCDGTVPGTAWKLPGKCLSHPECKPLKPFTSASPLPSSDKVAKELSVLTLLTDWSHIRLCNLKCVFFASQGTKHKRKGSHRGLVPEIVLIHSPLWMLRAWCLSRLHPPSLEASIS